MPRPARPKETAAKLEQNRAMWDTFGRKTKVLVTSWDPKQVQLVEAILEVVASGSTVVFRPGTGGGSVGVAIWERKVQHDPAWCNTAEELDAWADWVLEMSRGGEEAADD